MGELFFLVCVEGDAPPDQPGWTWEQTRQFVADGGPLQATANARLANFNIPELLRITDIHAPQMLDGGGSTQFLFRLGLGPYTDSNEKEWDSKRDGESGRRVTDYAKSRRP